MSSKVLKDALHELGRFYGVRTADEFLNQILDKQANIDLWNKPAGSEKTAPIARVISDFAGQSDIAISTSGIVKYITNNITDDAIKKELNASVCITPSTSLIPNMDDNQPANRWPKVSTPNGDDEEQGVFSPKANANYYTTDDYMQPGAKNNINVIQIFPSVGNLSNSDCDIVSLFLNSIPTLEISRAMPVMDITVLSKEENEEGFTKNLSLGKFLMGDTVTPEYSGMLNASDIFSKDIETSSGVYTPVASMEIFTSPQTMVPINPDGSLRQQGINDEGPLDPFQPLLSLSNMTINSVGTEGMHSYKSAEASLVLHDRGNLNTVLPLVSPGQLNDTRLQITYGWTHPEGTISYTTGQVGGGRQSDAEAGNRYADLINSMRHTELFKVVNSDFNFNEDGSVSINLSLATAGETSILTQDITISAIADAYDKLKEITDKVKAALRNSTGKRKKFGNISPPRSLLRSTNANSAAFLKPDQIKELREFISSAKSKDLKKVGKFITKLYKRRGGAVAKFNQNKASAIKEIIKHLQNTPDPFLGPVGNLKTNRSVTTSKTGRSPKNFKNSHNTKTSSWEKGKRRQKYVSLGKLLSYFMNSTLEDDPFTEIQLIFYPFNESAGWLFDSNVSQFPIPLDDLETILAERFKNSGRMSMVQFLKMLNAYFLKDQSMPGYNFTGVYGNRDPDNSRKRKFNSRLYKGRNSENPPDYQAINDKKEQIIAQAYGIEKDDPGSNFKPPQVSMKLEAMQMTDDTEGRIEPGGTKTLLKIHIYDKQCSSASTLRDVLESFSGDGTCTEQTRKSTNKRGAQHHKINSFHLNALSTKPNDLIQKLDTQAGLPKKIADETGLKENEIKSLLKGMYAINPNKSSRRIKDVYALMLPSLTYGSANSGILNAKVASMNNPGLTTVNMLKSNPNKKGANSGFDEGLPVIIAPTSLELEVLGCPYITIGQQFFVDMGTNTTADNFYGVFEVSHNFDNGKFTTSVRLGTMSSFGKWRSSAESTKSVIAATAFSILNAKPPETSSS